MTISTKDLDRISKQTTVLSVDGERLGTVDQAYTSDTTGDPAWVTLTPEHREAAQVFVPLAGAAFDGFNLKTVVTRDAVLGAPRLDPGGHLGVEEEDDLYRHYGLDNPDRTEDEVAAEAVGTEPVGEPSQTETSPASPAAP